MKRSTEPLFRPDKRLRTTEPIPQTASETLSATSSASHPVGYETLFEGDSPIVADIIFVHGLEGRQNTWSREGICWPTDLLAKEPALSNVRILSFGYDSRIVFGGQVSLNSLFKHSISFLNGLCRERDDDMNRPMIFIAHSLGGLIVKDAFVRSDTHRTTKPDLAAILNVTRGIIFLGTPHRGIGVNTLPELIAAVVQACQEVNMDLIQDLERESQTLDRIGDSFSQILDRRRIAVFSFEEELAMPGGKKVVEGGSAIIGDARERRDTIHADHVNMVKFSDRTDDGYAKILHAIKVMLAEDDLYSTRQNEAARSEVGVSSQVTRYYEIPPRHVPYYVQRKTLFARLEELLSDRCTSRPQIIVLLGMGGTGKTQLALEYCRRMKNKGNIGGIFWLNASSRNALESSMVAASKQLLPGRIVGNPRESVKLVRTTLSNWRDSWLLVFDNYDNPSEIDDIMDFFPDNPLGSILITSRSATSRELGEVIEIGQMEKGEGQELLLRSGHADARDLAVIDQILARLGYLPLAIDQVRAYISNQRLHLADFEGEYEMRKRNFMKETPRIWRYRRALPGMEEETSLNLLTTWELSLELLDVDMVHGGKLGDVLTLFAFLHPVDIREELFRRNIGHGKLSTSPMAIFEENGEWSHDKFERAVACMQDHSLIQFSRQGGDEIVVSLHSMVSEWLRLRLEKAVFSTTLKMAASHLEMYLASVDYVERQKALLHIDGICRIASSGNSDIVEFYLEFGRVHAEHGRLEDGERMFKHFLAEYEEKLGAEHIDTLTAVTFLGNVYTSQGRLAEAEEMYNRALPGMEKVLGTEDTLSLDTVINLGNLYAHQGRHVEAEKMYDRALAGKEKVLGAEHSSTLGPVINLGVLYAGQGRLVEAKKMYDRALAGYEKTLGADHPFTLNTVENLGNLYADQGRYVEAEKMYDRALAGREKAFGAEHPSTLSTATNLGLLYSSQSRLVDAENSFDRVLAAREKVLGAGHPSTLDAAHALGVLYADQGRLVKAEKMYDRALAGQEKALGPGHTSTLRTVHNLGFLYASQGRLEDAEEMYDRALAGYKKSLGAEHTLTLRTVNNLRDLYAKQGRLEDAKSMHSQGKLLCRDERPG